ncbi:uncharacterized protein FN964_016516 isoform 1-T1 [Alca torda]
MEQRSYSPPARTRVAAIRRRPHPPRPTQRKQNTLRNILWSCLCDYGEDMTAECRPQFAFTWRGVQYTWNRLPQGWKHSPTICHGLIQTALEKGGAPEHLQYIDDIIVWGNTAEEVFKKGKHRKWKAAVWSPTRRVAEATEGEGESSQFAEVKAIQLALDIAEREKWPILYLYTDSWMVANALWGWLKQWKQSNWQRRGKPIWAAELWQDIAERLGKLVVKVRHVDAHIPMSRATEEHQNNQQVDKAAKIFQTDLDWEHKGELFLARWAHDTSGHQGRDATYKWARDRGVDLTMDAIAQVIHDCETCAEIKQAKRLKPLWYGGRWLKYKYGEAWQIDYITLPQTRQGKRYVLTMVEASTGWLETYAVPHATARNTILGLERQVLWRHGTPERIESDNGTHFKNNLISAWAKEHGIEWVYHIPYHAPASGKIERYNGLLKTTLKSMGGGTFKNWDKHLAQATWLVNTRGSINRAGPAQSDLLHNIEGDKVPVVHERNMLGKAVWVSPASGKGKPIRGTVFAQGPGCTWWVMMENGEVQCVPQGNLTLGENTQL